MSGPNSYKAEVSNVAEQLRIWSESGSRPDEWLLREWAQRLKVVSDGLDGPSLPVYMGAMKPEEIAALADCKPGDIQVVYPLDDEWNAAVEACAMVIEGYGFGLKRENDIADELRELKRRTDATGSETSKEG